MTFLNNTFGFDFPGTSMFGASWAAEAAYQIGRQQEAADISPEMIAILREGKATTHDLSNAASGHAFNVGALTRKGLMERNGTTPDSYGTKFTHYVLTDAGRRYLETLS